MRISHKYKFIFFSNPKTGSESLREILDPYSDITDCTFREVSDENPFYSHITPIEVSEIFNEKGWDYNSYFKFICVRNPFAKLVSLYEMIYRRWPVKPPFSYWLKQTYQNGNGGGGKTHEKWRQYGTYALENLIMDQNSNMLVDKVLKLEDISKELPLILDQLGIETNDLKIIKKNTSKNKKKKVRDYYNDKLEKLVYDRYSWEIKKFNYQAPK
jgi:hypothetical protein